MRTAKRVLAFDLETIADKSIIDYLPEPKPKANLKDTAKIEADIEAKKEAQIKKLGLSPWTGRICCFGYAWKEGGEISTRHLMLKEETDEEEQQLIYIIWHMINSFDVFITFNGNGFDVPFLKGRSVRHRMKQTVNISMAKYRVTNHLDVKAVLSNWQPYEPGTLDFYSQILLNKTKTEGIDGSMVQEFWDKGKYKEIGKYCEDDCRLTFELGLLTKKYYL